MDISIYKDFLPADKQASFEADLKAYAKIESKEDAARLIADNKLVQAVFQSELSLAHQRSMDKFQAEKLPGLIDEGIKKLNPAKSPIEIELEKIKQELEGTRKEAKRKELLAIAQKEAAAKGIPLEIVDRFLDEDEESTKKTIESLGGIFESYRAKAIESHMSGVAGQGNTPKGGANGSQDFSKMTADQAMAYARQSPDHAKQVAAWKQANRR